MGARPWAGAPPTTSEERLSEVLSEFARTMVIDLPIQRILDRLVQRVVQILPVSGAGVTLIAPDAAPRYVAASDEDALRFERLQSDLDEGPGLEAYRTGLPVAVPDLSDCAAFPNFTRQALAAGLRAVYTLPLHHGDRVLGTLDLYRSTPGTMSPSTLRAAAILAGVVSVYLLNAQTRHDLQVMSDRTRHAALHDALTGLPNRVLLLDRLGHALKRSRRTGKDSALLYIDLDRFKAVNDNYGHAVGDALLVAVAERLADLVRPHDTLVRLAGDEFVVLCEDLDNPGQAQHIAGRLQYALQRPFELGDVTIQIGASIGMAYGDRDGGIDADGLLQDADMAMYAVKRLGTNRPDHDRRASGRLPGLAQDLPGALRQRQFHLEYQPIVSCRDGHILGMEALLRWVHPDRGLIGPRTVIPMAEQSGLMLQLGEWVVEQALRDAVDWQRHGLPIGLSVNLSPHQLVATGFAEKLATSIDGSGLPPELLTLDISESAFLRGNAQAVRELERLRGLGVSIALDNFGTGQSSLIHLQQYPVELLKIDAAFTAELGLHRSTDIIAGSIVSLAHELGMNVVAGGIETQEQHRQLLALGCDACQGFLFATPRRAEAADRLVADGSALTPLVIPAQFSAPDLELIPHPSAPESDGP